MPFITLPPRTYTASLAMGQLTSESDAAATIRMINVGTEKTLIRTQKTFPSPSFWRMENLKSDTDSLSAELDNLGPLNQAAGAFAPISGGLYACVFIQSGSMQIGAFDPAGTDPTIDTAFVDSGMTMNAGAFMGKYDLISNGNDKLFVTWKETGESLRYAIFNWNGTAFSVDVGPTTLVSGSGTRRTFASVTTDAAASRGLIAYADSSSISRIQSFTFNGSFVSGGTTAIGEVPAGDFNEQSRLVAFSTSSAGLIMRNAAPSDIKVFKVGNLTGAPTLSASATVTTGIFPHSLTLLDSSNTRAIAVYRKDAFTFGYKICDFAPATPTVGSEVTLTNVTIGADFFLSDFDVNYLADGRVILGNVADIGAAPNEAFYYIWDSL